MFAVFLWRAGWSYNKASTFFDTFFIRKNLESDQTFSTPKHIHHACTSLETCSWHWGHHQSLYHLAIKVPVSSEQPLWWSCYSVWFGDSRDSWTSLYSNMLTEDFVCCLSLFAFENKSDYWEEEKTTFGTIRGEGSRNAILDLRNILSFATYNLKTQTLLTRSLRLQDSTVQAIFTCRLSISSWTLSCLLPSSSPCLSAAKLSPPWSSTFIMAMIICIMAIIIYIMAMTIYIMAMIIYIMADTWCQC